MTDIADLIARARAYASVTSFSSLGEMLTDLADALEESEAKADKAELRTGADS